MDVVVAVAVAGVVAEGLEGTKDSSLIRIQMYGTSLKQLLLIRTL